MQSQIQNGKIISALGKHLIKTRKYDLVEKEQSRNHSKSSVAIIQKQPMEQEDLSSAKFTQKHYRKTFDVNEVLRGAEMKLYLGEGNTVDYRVLNEGEKSYTISKSAGFDKNTGEQAKVITLSEYMQEKSTDLLPKADEIEKLKESFVENHLAHRMVIKKKKDGSLKRTFQGGMSEIKTFRKCLQEENTTDLTLTKDEIAECNKYLESPSGISLMKKFLYKKKLMKYKVLQILNKIETSTYSKNDIKNAYSWGIYTKIAEECFHENLDSCKLTDKEKELVNNQLNKHENKFDILFTSAAENDILPKARMVMYALTQNQELLEQYIRLQIANEKIGHKDAHGNNILLDVQKNKLFVIDFDNPHSNTGKKLFVELEKLLQYERPGLVDSIRDEMNKKISEPRSLHEMMKTLGCKERDLTGINEQKITVREFIDGYVKPAISKNLDRTVNL